MKNIVKSVRPNEFVLMEQGFSGIRGDIEDELLPYGMVADIKNLVIDRSTGLLQSVAQPTSLGQVASGEVLSIFVWEKDDGSKTIFAQVGTDLYYLSGTTWISLYTFSDSSTLSYVSGMLDKMYVMHPVDGLYSYDGTTFSSISTAPKGKYITLWYNRLFVGGDLNDGTYAPYRVRWSNLNDFTTWDANDFVDFRTPENSKITGFKPYKQALYVSTASSISAVNLGFQNYEVYKGDLAPKDNLIALLNGFYFVNDFGLYALDGSDVPIKIGTPFKKYWKATPPQSLVAFGDKIYYLADDSILVYDTSTKTYTRLVYGDENVLYSADHLYLGTTDGYVYELDVPTAGYLDWDVKTKVYNFGFQANRKRPKELYIYWKSTSTSSFDVNAYYDYATSPKHLGTVSYTPSGTIWGSFTWGSAPWTAAQGDIVESGMYIYEDLIRTMQLEFSGSGEFGLAGFNIIFKPYRRYGR